MRKFCGDLYFCNHSELYINLGSNQHRANLKLVGISTALVNHHEMAALSISWGQSIVTIRLLITYSF